MPRNLTRKEIEYLEILKERNIPKLKSGNPDLKEGLNTPMTAKERMMRKRIRAKALVMVKDLVSIYMAGILPGGAIKCPEPECMIEKRINNEIIGTLDEIEMEQRGMIPDSYTPPPL